MDEKVIGILAAAAGVAATEAAELIKTDDGIADLQSKITGKLTEVKDNADKRATLKTRTAVETALKAKGIENPSFAKLADHLEELEGKALETSNSGKLSDEQVLQLPAVKKLRNEMILQQEQAVQRAKEETEKSLQGQISEFHRKQTQSTVRQKAEQILAELKPVFDSDPTRAAKQKQRLLDDLVSGSYQVDQDGTVRLLDQDGELKKDEMGNTIKFQDHVKQVTTDYYPLQAATDRQSAGLRPEDVNKPQTGALKHFKGELPKTVAEFEKLANDPKLSVDALQELDTYWKEQSKAG